MNNATDTTCSDPSKDRGRAEIVDVMADSSEDDVSRWLPTPEQDVAHRLIRDRVRSQLFGARAITKIGRFEIERKLGRGGMGEVFLARDPELRRQVAVKLLHGALLERESGTRRERARREGQALAQVNHPNVIEVYEVGEHEGQPFVAMEYVEGQTLGVWLAKAKPRWREIVEVYVEAGRGLLAAHRAGLVHRDFKPDNVLISGTGAERRVRVLDFGIARRVDAKDLQLEPTDDGEPSGELTRPGTVIGTLAYMPPEQLRGELADAASDQFSFCVALYEALWGQPPFAGRSIDQRLACMTGEPEVPRHAGVPSKLATIVRRGLAPVPEQRWPDMAELLAALEQVIRGRRTWPALVLGGLVFGVGLGLAAADRATPTPDDPCRHVEARSAELWTPAHLERARARFEASPEPYADQSFATVDAALTEWTRAWSTTRMQVCRRGEEAKPRAGCLDRLQAEVAPLVAAMVAADERTIAVAVASLAELPSLNCEDDEAYLLGLAPIPVGVEDELDSARGALAKARVSLVTGHFDAAGEALTALERDTAGLDYEPFRAELALMRARLELQIHEPSVSFPKLAAAALLAEGTRHDRLAAHAWTLLAHWGANRIGGPHEDTAAWLLRAETDSKRLGSPPDLEVRLQCTLGVLLGHDEARVDEARAAFQRGLELLRTLPQNDAEWLGIGAATTQSWRPVCLANLAALETGPAALELAETALAQVEELYGPNHPQVGHYSYMLAQFLLDSDDPESQARSKLLLEQAAATYLQRFDGGSIEAGDAHVALAWIAVDEGRLAPARVHAAAAREVYVRVLAPDDYLQAQPSLIEGAIDWAAGEPAAALEHFDRARPFLTGPGLEAALAEVDARRAECLLALESLDPEP